jgi:uncharacterized protein with PIN domain
MNTETLKPNEYRCARCNGVFEKGWTDEAAIDELNQKFPRFSTAMCELVCDDCYRAIGLSEEPLQ